MTRNGPRSLIAGLFMAMLGSAALSALNVISTDVGAACQGLGCDDGSDCGSKCFCNNPGDVGGTCYSD